MNSEKLPPCPVCGATPVKSWTDRYGNIVEISVDPDEDDNECPHEYHGFSESEYRTLCAAVEKAREADTKLAAAGMSDLERDMKTKARLEHTRSELTKERRAHWTTRDRLQEAESKLAAAEKERDRRDRILQSLTPGGSEYVNDPERCAEYVRQTRQQQFEAIKRFKKERDAEQKRCAELESLFRELANDETILTAICSGYEDCTCLACRAQRMLTAPGAEGEERGKD